MFTPVTRTSATESYAEETRPGRRPATPHHPSSSSSSTPHAGQAKPLRSPFLLPPSIPIPIQAPPSLTVDESNTHGWPGRGDFDLCGLGSSLPPPAGALSSTGILMVQPTNFTTHHLVLPPLHVSPPGLSPPRARHGSLHPLPPGHRRRLLRRRHHGLYACRRRGGGGVVLRRLRPPPPLLPGGPAVGGGPWPPRPRRGVAGQRLARVLLRALPPRPRPPRPPRPRRRRRWPPHLRRRQHHLPIHRIVVLRGGEAWHAERDVPGGAGHRQRPLLGALRLQAVRVHPQRHRRPGHGPAALQPAAVVDEQAGDLRQRALRPPQRLQRRHQRQLPVRRALRVRQHLLLRRARRGRAPPHQGGPGLRRRRRGGREGLRRVRVRAGADGRVPRRRRLRRPDGPGHGQGVRASVLAAKGLVASDSFSMCFGDDGVGRINFGDAGGAGQSETLFVTAGSTRPTYNVSFTAINAGSKSVPVEFAAVMDSGTSFTYLNDPEYTELATNFNSEIRERRANFSSGSAGRFPFEYCYRLSPNQTAVELPIVSLTTAGGALFPVTDPIIVLYDRVSGHAIGYCLAILKSEISINIVGQNFMTGLKVVFNRERSVLGWEKFDCYKNARAADAPDASPSPGPAPAPARPTTLTPKQNDANNRYPGAAPVPRSAGSPRALGMGGLLSLLLPLLLAVAVLV